MPDTIRNIKLGLIVKRYPISNSFLTVVRTMDESLAVMNVITREVMLFIPA